MGVWSRRAWVVEKAAPRKAAACRKHISSAQLGNHLIYFISSAPSLRRQIWVWNMDTEQNIKRDLIKWVIMFSLNPLMQAGGTNHHKFSTLPVSVCEKGKKPWSQALWAHPCEEGWGGQGEELWPEPGIWSCSVPGPNTGQRENWEKSNTAGLAQPLEIQLKSSVTNFQCLMLPLSTSIN